MSDIQKFVAEHRQVVRYEDMITPQCYVYLSIVGTLTSVEAERLIALIRALVPERDDPQPTPPSVH